MLKFLVTFAVGFYAGVFVDQNYKLPNVSDPQSIYEEVKKWMEKYQKDDKGK